MWRCLLLLCLALALEVSAQPLRDPDREAEQLESAEGASPDTPLIMRDVPAASRELTVEQAVARIREEMREIAQAALTEAQRREALDALYERNARIFKIESTERDNIPLTAEEAVNKLERLMFEVALDVTPGESTREQMLENASPHLVEPNRPLLIAPRANREQIVITREAEEEGLITPWWKTTRFDSEALDLQEVAESPVEQLEPPEENLEEAPAEVKVEVLADEKVTVEMHDDTTILREVETARGDLVLFDALNIWIGGSLQYDLYAYEDLLNARNHGKGETETSIRRGEGIVRATLTDSGEVKLQYDLDSNIWRDLYYRLADSERAFTLTVGNQTEPVSQESLLGNKFNAAMETSAPTSTFGSYTGAGITLNNWFEREKGERFMGFGAQSLTYITTAIGVYGQDIEDTNDTDLALTGRLTWGRQREDGSGLHVGVMGTYRDGDFDRINPRPGFVELDRIVLARFEADTAAVLGAEAMYTRGSLHASSEVYVADYSGGDVDGDGFGGFLTVGYYLTGQERTYRPQWGLWAPLQVGARNVFEVFARVSYTYGDTAANPSNDLGVLTVGGSWYRHKFRSSLNLLYSVTDSEINGEDSGLGAGMRVQYLF